MDFNRLKLLSSQDRLMTLQNEALSIEEEDYTKPLSDDEFVQVKEELASASIAKAFAEEELRIHKEDYKAKVAPHQAVITQSIASLKTGVKSTRGKLYKMPDYDNKMVYMVDGDGNIISSRMMKPEERQIMIGSSIQRTAANE